MKLLLLPIILIATFLSYSVFRIAAEHIELGPPRVVAVLCALLTATAMLHFGDAVITLVLLPYAAVGTALLFLWLLRWLLARGVIGKLRHLLADVRALSKQKPSPPQPKDPAATGVNRGRIRPTHEGD